MTELIPVSCLMIVIGIVLLIKAIKIGPPTYNEGVACGYIYAGLFGWIVGLITYFYKLIFN